MTDAFPLQWPAHIQRTHPSSRTWGPFKVTPDQAARELRDEVARSGGAGLVISTNIPVRRDGQPHSRAREPDDPGVAVYFHRKGMDLCITCDAYDRVWKNIRAVGLSIKDMRGPEGRGCSQITDQAFTGFAALPPPPDGKRSWWVVLGVQRDATPTEIKAAYHAEVRTAAMNRDEERARELNVARDEALTERAISNG